MSFLRIGALTLRIVRQFLRDPRTLALVFLAPILVMTLLNLVLNNQTSAVSLAVVLPTASDQITTVFNQNLKQALAQQSDTLSVSYIAASDADSALDNGDVNGVLIFPPDFATQLQQGNTAAESITLKLDGSNPGAAKALNNAVAALLQNLAQRAAPASQNTGALPSASPAPTLNSEYVPASSKDYTQTDSLAPLFVGLFAFFFIFLLTSVSFLRERSRGTIERLLISPLSRAELVLGYVVGFSIFAVVQSLLILLYVIYVLRVHYAGNLGLIFLITLALTVGSVNLGIFLSTYARNELQVIQFIPLVIVPQALLGGLFWPVNSLPVVLKQIAYVMPLTWANFGLKDIMLKGKGLETIWPDLVVLVVFAALMVVLSTFIVRREAA
ncbi:MAG TPA: ABC transporter permease [Ktedonobacterales bacterium]|nr:ABC transporter permease [Ktedonobacterales bacterium]